MTGDRWSATCSCNFLSMKEHIVWSVASTVRLAHTFQGRLAPRSSLVPFQLPV